MARLTVRLDQSCRSGMVPGQQDHRCRSFRRTATKPFCRLWRTASRSSPHGTSIRHARGCTQLGQNIAKYARKRLRSVRGSGRGTSWWEPPNRDGLDLTSLCVHQVQLLGSSRGCAPCTDDPPECPLQEDRTREDILPLRLDASVLPVPPNLPAPFAVVVAHGRQ